MPHLLTLPTTSQSPELFSHSLLLTVISVQAENSSQQPATMPTEVASPVGVIADESCEDRLKETEVTNKPDGAVLSDQQYKFSAHEPAINRYGEGGAFMPHTDSFAVTLNILLTIDTFEGGGTTMWREPCSQPSAMPALRVEPSAVGVGVLFNGTMRHAGREVTAGLRHLLVASFSIDHRQCRKANSQMTEYEVI